MAANSSIAAPSCPLRGRGRVLPHLATWDRSLGVWGTSRCGSIGTPFLVRPPKVSPRASCKPLSRCSSGVAGLPFPRRCVGAPGVLQSGSKRRAERRAGGTASAGNTLATPMQQNIQPDWFRVKLRYRVPIHSTHSASVR